MATIGLHLIISARSGNKTENIGGVFGLPMLIFSTPTNPWPPLAHGYEIANRMQVGDELKEIVMKQQARIMRASDAHSIDLYQAFQSGKRFLIIVNVYVLGSDGKVISNATLTITDAKMTFFNRVKRNGIIANKHLDNMTFSFARNNTKLEYGRDINAVAKEKGIDTAIGRTDIVLF